MDSARRRLKLGLDTAEGKSYYYYQTFVAGKNVVHDFMRFSDEA